MLTLWDEISPACSLQLVVCMVSWKKLTMGRRKEDFVGLENFNSCYYSYSTGDVLSQLLALPKIKQSEETQSRCIKTVTVGLLMYFW